MVVPVCVAVSMQNTRKAVLSSSNPYYYSGSIVSGVGSPHTGPGERCMYSLPARCQPCVMRVSRVMVYMQAACGPWLS